MKADTVRNLRLVASTTLLSLWGYSHLAQTPVLGNTVAPLVLALLLAPGADWFGRRGRGGYRSLVVALLAFAAITGLLYWTGSTAALESFGHSPWLVIPLWGLGLFGLVRNATSAGRSAASAQAAAAAAAAHAADAG